MVGVCFCIHTYTSFLFHFQSGQMCVETSTRWWGLQKRGNICFWSGRQEEQGKNKDIPKGLLILCDNFELAIWRSVICNLYLILLWHYHLPFVDLLSKPVPPCKTLPGPQNFVLRCGAIPLLCDDRSWQYRLPSCRILLQGTLLVAPVHLKLQLPCKWLFCSNQNTYLGLGKEFIPELQCLLHPDHATVYEAGLWQDADWFQWVQ